jgi:hypothetical protein
MAGKVGMHKRRASGSNSVAYADAVRSRIRAGLITNYLTNHLLGHITLSATQVRAAEILLRKVVPDLSEHSGAIDLNVRGRDELIGKLRAAENGGGAYLEAADGGAAGEPPGALH